MLLVFILFTRNVIYGSGENLLHVAATLQADECEIYINLI